MASLNHAKVGNDIFFTNDYVTFGFNDHGTLGTAAARPFGFPGNFTNVGLFGGGIVPSASDSVLPGTPTDSFTIAHDGVDFTNDRLTSCKGQGPAPDPRRGKARLMSRRVQGSKSKGGRARGRAGSCALRPAGPRPFRLLEIPSRSRSRRQLRPTGEATSQGRKIMAKLLSKVD